MEPKNNIKNYNLVKSEESSEEINKLQKNIPNNLKLLNDKYLSSKDFYNKNTGKILNLDYIPKELFASLKNQNSQNNIKEINNFEKNQYNSSYLDEKSKELKSSKKIEKNNDFKISQNEFIISGTFNKENNISNSDIKNQQTINSNIHLAVNLSKETNSNKRYNEEKSYANSNEKSNQNSNNKYISQEMSNESSTLRHNISNYNGLSDHFINSFLNISNSILSNNIPINSPNKNYLDKIKLRELETKENYLIELEKKRTKDISELIEKQKIELSQRLKEKEEMKKNLNDNYFSLKGNDSSYKHGINHSKNVENENISYNNDINDKMINQIKNINKNNEVISYFNNLKKDENIIKNKMNSNRSTNLNYKTSTSFYTKRTYNMQSPLLSSAFTDINNNNFIHQNYTSMNTYKNKKKKLSKPSKKIYSSKKNISHSSSHITKSIRSLEYNPAYSLKEINYLDNFNNNSKIIKKIKKIKGKEKIQDKYNIYFNCFIPTLYEEQKEKLLKEKKIKKSKSSTKLKKLDDYVGPNLYNEKVEMPDFGYICYKTNKKINPKYSLCNTLNSNNKFQNNNYMFLNSNNSSNNENYISNLSLRKIYNNYENSKNNSVNEFDDLNYNNYKTKINEERQNYPDNDINDELMNKRIYEDLYNKAFSHINYQQYYNNGINSTEDINKNLYY